MPGQNRDTVEEFWDTNTLKLCSEQARYTHNTNFLDELCLFLGASGKMWATRSGRVALQQLLVDAVSGNRESVLICSFNCQVVADAVIEAGFQVETFDLTDSNGRIDWEAIAAQLSSRHGAVVVPHLFGVPSDFRPAQAIAQKLGVVVVEDCAPTLGGKIGSAMAGTLGDAAIFSFNYDKPISLGGGGALLVNNPNLWPKIRLKQNGESLETELQELDIFVKYLQKRRQNIHKPSQSQPGFTHKVFRRLKRMVQPPKTKDLFPTSGIGPLRAALGLWQLGRYQKVMNKRNENAALFSDESRYQSWYVGSDVRPAWLKQKVILSNSELISNISHNLQKLGLRVGPFNWSKTIDQYLGLQEKPYASHVARYGLDIPIHQNMTRDELELIHHEIWSEVSN